MTRGGLMKRLAALTGAVLAPAIPIVTAVEEGIQHLNYAGIPTFEEVLQAIATGARTMRFGDPTEAEEIFSEIGGRVANSSVIEGPKAFAYAIGRDASMVNLDAFRNVSVGTLRELYASMMPTNVFYGTLDTGAALP